MCWKCLNEFNLLQPEQFCDLWLDEFENALASFPLDLGHLVLEAAKKNRDQAGSIA